jgi:uncharacterized protein (DUF305 family)
MKKTTLVVIAIFLFALLSVTVYAAVALFTTTSVQPCCPFVNDSRQYLQDERGTGRGFGMMRPGMMGLGMMDAMQVDIDSELDFLAHMIPHHQEAVTTAIYLRDNSDRPEMKEFAEDIIRIQTAEVEQMTLYLETWYPDQIHQVDYQPMMRNLEGLRGDALDRAFLEDMIPHHMVAVMMSQQLLTQGLAEHEEVALLAGSIRNSQRNEIHMMMNWLAAWDNDNPIAGHRNLSMIVLGGLLLLLAFIALVVLLIIMLIPKNKRQRSADLDSHEILDRRYAKGEISREEYLEIRQSMK